MVKRIHKWNKKNIRNSALFCGTIAIVLFGIYAPGRILAIQSEAALDEVTAVPEQYYSSCSSAMARNASANLGVHEKIQLITGDWESETMEAAAYEMELEDYEAVEKAREGIRILYEKGLYPSTISTDYGDWYHWQATPCKALDNTFRTYAAYYWKIEFERYDGKKRHTVYLLEDGTVFLAKEYAQEGCDIEQIKDATEVLAGQEALLAVKQNLDKRNLDGMLPYYEEDLTGVKWKALTEITSGEDVSLIIQGFTKKTYVFAISLAD